MASLNERDLKQLKRAKEIRSQPSSGPFRVFLSHFEDIVAMWGEDIESPVLRRMLSKYAIIATVTAVEVFFRDTLVFIFSACKPESYLEAVKHSHKDKKYTIDDLLSLEQTRTHPLELVAASINFQNFETVTSLFSKIIGRSIWEEAFKKDWRFDESQEVPFTSSSKDLIALQRIIDLRHELIHHPDHRQLEGFEKHGEEIAGIGNLIGCVQCVMVEFYDKNLTDELRKWAEENKAKFA